MSANSKNEHTYAATNVMALYFRDEHDTHININQHQEHTMP